MKLKSLHIENFGKLSDVDFSFETGVNVLCEENGWGKSTLAAFLKAMLYGLEGDNKRDDFQCERKRFAPWQGGAFGGKLIFEAAGRTYSAERFFGNKASDDTFTLRDFNTNLESSDYSEHLGEELFSINAESFLKTVFVSQLDISNSSSTDDINAKLGNISDGLDLNKFALVDAKLKDEINSLSATRKTGEISRYKARASELKADINKGIGLDDTMAYVEGRINDNKVKILELRNELTLVNEKIKEASKREQILKDKSHYEEMLADFSAKEKALKECSEYFPGEIPTKENVIEWSGALDDINESEAIVKSTSFSELEAGLYESLLLTFKDGVPTEESFDIYLKKAKRYTELKTKALQNSLSKEDEDALYIFKNKYEDPDTAISEINEAGRRLSERKGLLEKKDLISNKLTDSEYERVSHKSKAPFVFMLLAFILILSSAALIYFTKQYELNYIFSYIPAAAGFIFIILALISKRKSKTRDEVFYAEISKLEADIEVIDEEIAGTDEYIEGVKEKFGYISDSDDAYEALQTLLNDAFTFKSLKKRESLSVNAAEREEIESLSNELSTFLSSFLMTSENASYEALIIDLKGKAQHFKSLERKENTYKASKEKLVELKDKLLASLNFYKINPGLDVVFKTEEVIKVLDEYDSLYSLYKDAYDRLENFKKSVNLQEIYRIADDDGASLDELHGMEAKILDDIEIFRNNLSTDNRSLDEYSRIYEEINDKKAELTELEEKIADKSKHLDYVVKTSEFFTKAKENLTAKYMAPLLRGFKKYYGVLTEESGDNYHIDANTVITVEEKGKQRDTKFLSRGYQDLVGLCERLSMADAMYPDEKPILLFDDPFVNLDDKKMEGAKLLLNEISKDYQVIYLTCRENRI